MSNDPDHPNNPLQGVTLEQMLDELVERLGWEKMGQWVRIACFKNDPSIASSLKFLRKTPWARTKVELMYRGLKRRRPPRA